MTVTRQAAPVGKGGHKLILTGLMLGVLLAALDQTIVSASAGTIVADIGGFEHFAWMFAAYMLASTIVIPMAGKASDLYGRRPVYLVGMSMFLVGSVLCGTATTMEQLILYRSIQGLGGGMIFPVALATIADLYPPSERGRIQGLIGAMFGLASVVGPFLGGWISDSVHVGDISSWRWVFYINIPIGAVALTMVARHFPRITTRSTAPIDFLGIATLSIALFSGLLVAVWGGETYTWTSPQILALGALAAAAFATFIVAERRAADPVIPLDLFRNPIVAVGVTASLLMGAGMFAVITFMPTYMQGVVGISATYSGTALIPLSMSLVAGSIVSGQMMKRHGYKPFAVAGTLIAAAGFTLLYFLTRTGIPSVWVAILEMTLLGAGLGFTIQTYMVAGQNATPRRQAGAVSSVFVLVRSLGATVGITVLGVVLNRRVSSQLHEHVEAGMLNSLLQNPFVAGNINRVPSLLLKPDAVAALRNTPGGDAAIEGIKLAYSNSISAVFIAGAFIAASAFLVTLFLRSIPMKDAEAYAQEAPDAAPVATQLKI